MKNEQALNKINPKNKIEWDYIETEEDVLLFFLSGQRELVAIMHEGKMFKCVEYEDSV